MQLPQGCEVERVRKKQLLVQIAAAVNQQAAAVSALVDAVRTINGRVADIEQVMTIEEGLRALTDRVEHLTTELQRVAPPAKPIGTEMEQLRSRLEQGA